MSKLTSLIRRAPKRFSAAIAIVAAAIIVPAAVFAWGPSRPTFTGAHPAPYVTFNSITDNPDVGDERNFVRIRPAGQGTYAENVNVQAGQTYDVMVYYHNNASSKLNASGEGIAKDVMLRMQMEANIKANSETDVTGFITSSNAKPTEVYDSATLKNTSNATMNMSFVENSAKVTSNGAVNGKTLPNSVFTSGTPLGFDSLNETLPGCNEYSGYVIFQVKANQPNFTVEKQVHKTGTTGWKETEAVQPGDSVDYLISYKNTGTTQQNNVVLKDVLPQGISYVKGTTLVANQANPQGLLLDAKSDNLTTTGVNIGNYGPGANAFIKFTAKVANNDKIPSCGPNKLTNKATIETDNGSKSDTADVTVNRKCVPIYSCNSLGVEKISRTEFKFSTNYFIYLANFKNITYVIRDANGNEIDRKVSNGVLNYTQTKPGKFTVQAIVKVTVDGKEQSATSDNCKKPFEVTPKPAAYECKALTVNRISRTEFKFTTNYSIENATFKKITYIIRNAQGQEIDRKTSTNSTLNYTQTKTGKYSVQAVVTVSVNGQEKTTTSADCKKEFEVTPKPVVAYECESLTVKRLSRTEFTFTTDYSTQNATFKSVTYIIRDAQGNEIDRKVSTGKTLNYTQNTDGKYSVQAVITVTVNGQTKTATSDNCKKAFEVPAKPVIAYTCDSLTVKRLSRTEFNFTTDYTVKNATFKSVTYIIRNAQGQEVDRKTTTANTLKYTREIVGKYSVQAVITVTVNGQTKTATSDNCKKEFEVPAQPEYCPIPGKEHLPKDSPDCKETPVTPPTPPELPHTGAGDNIVAILGLGALIASIAYYAASRRALS